MLKDANPITNINDIIKSSNIDWGVGADQVSAVDVPYNNTDSGLVASDIKSALDELDSAITAEDLWDRSGTILSPHTAGDSIHVTRIGLNDYAPSSTAILQGSENFTHQSGTRYGYLINTIHEPAGALASTTTMFGGLSQAQYRTDVDGSVLGYMYGHQSNANTLQIAGGFGGSGDLFEAIGEWGRARHRSDGTLTNAIGVRGDVYNDNASTNNGDIINASSFLATCDSKKTTGIIHDRYGLEIQDIATAAHTTNQYGVYCPALVGAITDNYFLRNISAPSDLGSGNLTTTGTMYANGYGANIVAKTAAYTVTGSDDVIICGAGNETFTINFPLPLKGKIYHIKNVGTGTITVDANTTGGTTIDGVNTMSLSQYESIQIISDSSNYWIM